MSNQYQLNAESRGDKGKGASRRLRRLEERVPGIIYGGNAAPAMISVSLRELNKALENEAFYSQVLTINLDGAALKAVLRDMQRHPVKNIPTHIDLQRVDEHHKITMRVPLHFINETSCVGVKEQGGEIHHDLAEVEVNGLPKHLPEFLTVDMAEVTVGNSVHLSDIKLPEGVTLVQLAHGHDLAVANVHAVKVGGDEAAAEGEKKE
jgi:large subunit ribosomal protein L25